jgi:hypothetical protein
MTAGRPQSTYGGVRIVPTSAGSSLGACNWTVLSGHCKLVYVSASATARNRHPESLDVAALEHAHVLLLHDLCPTPDQAPAAMLNELSAVCGTLPGRAGHPRRLVFVYSVSLGTGVKRIQPG